MAAHMCRTTLAKRLMKLTSLNSDGVCGPYRIISRTKVDKMKSTIDYENLAPKKLNIQITDDGIFKNAGALLDATHTVDGKPIYPGKHKWRRLEEGAIVTAGNFLCYQKKLDYHPGLNVGIGRDLTLYAYEAGQVYITWERVRFNWENKFVNEFYYDEKEMNIYKPYYHVITKEQPRIFKLVERI